MMKIVVLLFFLLCSCVSQKPQKHELQKETSQELAPRERKEAIRGLVEDMLEKSFRFQSRYDDQEHTIVVKESKDPHAALLILLQDASFFPEFCESDAVFQVKIPSRVGLNYQLISEGDFWDMLAFVETSYPQLRGRPRFLLGEGSAADAALFFANAYRSEFSGVAVSGAKISVQLKNLDFFPVREYASGGDLVDWLAARGNSLALATKTAEEAVQELMQVTQPLDLIAPFTFDDMRHAKVSPWLTVLEKKSELEPAKIEAFFEDRTLKIRSHNVQYIQLHFADEALFQKLADVNRVEFDGASFVFEPYKIEQRFGKSLQEKAATPSFFANFFRSEKVYIVYQDRGDYPDFLQKTYTFASRLASLDFEGMPPIAASLPMIPLSQYDEKALEDHRAIFFGNEEAFLLPMQTGTNSVFFTQKALPLAYTQFDEVAYSLSLGKKLFYVAPSVQGMEALEKRVLSATALFDTHDVEVFVKVMKNYQIAYKTRLNNAGRQSSFPALLVELPAQKKEAFAATVQKLVEGTLDAEHYETSPLVSQYAPLPSMLNYTTLKQLVPQRLLAVLIPNEKSRELFPTWPKEGATVVDAAPILKLPDVERAQLIYKIAPFEPFELIYDQLCFAEEDFAKNYLHAVQGIAEKSEENRADGTL